MKPEEIRDAVSAAGQRHYSAATSGDTAALQQLLCDDVVYGHSNGFREGKTSYLERVASGLYRELTVDHSPNQIWVLGDIAVVAATQHNSGRVGTHEWPNGQESVSLDVWCRRDGRWQLLAHQTTLTRPPRPDAD